MNTILIAVLPNNYVRCVLSDQSTVTLEESKLDEWLVEHPLVIEASRSPTIGERLMSLLKRIHHG